MAQTQGRRVEDLARDVLEREGYAVDQASPETRSVYDGVGLSRVRAYDRFGCFDLVAVHPRGEVRLVQVTHPRGVAARLVKIVERADWPVQADWCRVELWEWLGHGFRVHRLHESGWQRAGAVPVTWA